MKIINRIGILIFSLTGMFVAISFVSSVYAETPVTSGIGGTSYHNVGWDGYTMGFRFKPNVNGQITALRAYSICSGTARNVRLYSDAGAVIASASVVQNGGWAQTSITPVNVTAGTYYRIGVYPSSCASYFNPPSPTFPATIGNITIDTGAYSSGDASPSTWTETNLLRGIPDFDFTTGGGGGLDNGAGGSYTCAGCTNQQHALAACESKYGVGACTTGACGSFSYYYPSSGLSCNCSTAIDSYQWIYNNTGYTQVGQDYGGQATDVSGDSLFVRKKGSSTCDSNSWILALKDLGAATSGGGSCTLFPGSQIATSGNETTVAGWLPSTKQGTLLYRRSTNGSVASTFHSLVDNQGETISLIKTTNNRVIGGYNPSSWSSSGSYLAGTGGFLFNLTYGFRLTNTNSTYMTYNNNGYGPCFGGGHDMCVSDSNTSTGYNNTHSYQNPSTYGYSYLEGVYSWNVSDIEVYKLSACTGGNTAPTISISPFASYGSYTRTGPSTSFAVNFTATDAEQTGANQLTYYIHTGANRTGTQVVTGTFTSGSVATAVAYNATGLSQGTNTLYLSVYDGTAYSATNPSFTVQRDDSVTAPSSISHTPNPVTTNNQYTITFTASDTYSTNTNEMLYQVRTAAGGGGTLIGSGNFTQGAGITTSTLTDSTLVAGSNTRYLRIRDGANNYAETSFTVTKVAFPTVTTDAASSVTQTTATLNGTGNPNGYATTGWFRYFTSNPGTCSDVGGTRVPSSSGTSLGSGSTGVAYNNGITGLTPGTSYWSCAIASNANGTGVGSPVQFTTAVGTPTTVTTSTGESGLGSYYVTLNGSANPNNYASYGFFRVYTTNPGSCADSGGIRYPASSGEDLSLGSGSTGVAFSYEAVGTSGATDIEPGTTYYYCAFARNQYAPDGSAVGSSGSDTFSTPDGAVSACDPPTSGNHTVSTSCSYTGSVGGVDGGTGTNNTATLIIGSTKSLTVNPAQQVAWGSISMQSGASINLSAGSSLRRSPVWVVDADGDGIIGSTTQYIGVQPAGGVRRNTVNTTYPYFSKILSATTDVNAPIILDCNDNSAYAYRMVANLVKDADQDGYKTATAAAPQCVGASAVINGRTYYNDGSGPN